MTAPKKEASEQEAKGEAGLQILQSTILAGLQSGPPEQWKFKEFRKKAKNRMGPPRK